MRWSLRPSQDSITYVKPASSWMVEETEEPEENHRNSVSELTFFLKLESEPRGIRTSMLRGAAIRKACFSNSANRTRIII